MIQKINIAQKLTLFNEHWSPKIVGRVNNFDVKVVKLLGEFDWHHHDEEDELFWVIKGSFVMQLRDQEDIVVNAGEVIIIPHGIEHRPLAEAECEIVLFEPAGTLNTGNIQSERTVSDVQEL